MTSDIKWDPIIYGNSISNLTTWYDDVANETTPFIDPNFDQTGNYKHSKVTNHSTKINCTTLTQFHLNHQMRMILSYYA